MSLSPLLLAVKVEVVAVFLEEVQSFLEVIILFGVGLRFVCDDLNDLA